MPYLMIQTNRSLSPEVEAGLLEATSSVVSQVLGKSEEYVMVAIESNTPMLFGRDRARTAYLELKSIGFPEQKAGELVAVLSEVIENRAKIPRQRVFITFSSHPRNLWGWNGETF